MVPMKKALYGMARAIMCEANFNLRSWASNSTQLQAIAQGEKVADPNQVVNLLGLHQRALYQSNSILMLIL